jgi:predicted DNA-binding transcriptional regulator AlpA
MSKLNPLFARSSTVARLLDMPTSEFRRLVDAGALPPPVKIGEHERWRVSQIEAILMGGTDRPNQEFEL